jgi:hypothetical protein
MARTLLYALVADEWIAEDEAVVVAAFREAIAEEREECAVVALREGHYGIARAIRARGGE